MEGLEVIPSAVVTCVGGGGLAAGKVVANNRVRERDKNERFRGTRRTLCVHCRVDLGHEVCRVGRRAARYDGNGGRRLLEQVLEGRPDCED